MLEFNVMGIALMASAVVIFFLVLLSWIIWWWRKKSSINVTPGGFFGSFLIYYFSMGFLAGLVLMVLLSLAEPLMYSMISLNIYISILLASLIGVITAIIINTIIIKLSLNNVFKETNITKQDAERVSMYYIIFSIVMGLVAVVSESIGQNNLMEGLVNIPQGLSILIQISGQLIIWITAVFVFRYFLFKNIKE